MTTAVLEKPVDVDLGGSGHQNDNNTTPDLQATTIKPEGVTTKTWNALSQQGMIFFNARCAGADSLTAYDIAGYDPDGTNATHRRRNAKNIERAKRMVKVKLEHEQHKEECEAFDKRCDLDWIVAEHRRIMADAHEKGDLAVETRNLELIGRTRGVYADSVRIDVAARREYSEAEEIEGRHLARLRLEEMGEVPDEVLVEDVQVQAQVERERGEDGKFVAGESSEATDAPRARSSL